MRETEVKLVEPGPEQELLDPPRHHVSRVRIWLMALVALAVLAGLFLIGYLPRQKRERGNQKEAHDEETSLPIVNTAKVKKSPPASELLLPGNMTPVTEAYVFARSAGYLKKRYVDIGDHVKQGQILAAIDARDLDQQVMQAQATLSQTRAALGRAQASLEQANSQQHLTDLTLQRWKTLVARGVLAKQEGDQKQADYDNATALVHVAQANIRAAEDNVRASEANVRRLIELQGYEKVRAPFTGVITARSVDTGSLISASGAGQGTPSVGSTAATSSGSELFRIAQDDILRILINVPQAYASSVHVGMSANITLQESSRRKFAGKVTRTANSLDQATRTLLTELQVPNRQGALMPGMYAQVQFVSERADPPLLIPGGNKVHFEPVDVGRDYGTDIEITGGLKGGETVIVNPSDDVREGAEVKPAAKGAASKKKSG